MRISDWSSDVCSSDLQTQRKGVDRVGEIDSCDCVGIFEPDAPLRLGRLAQHRIDRGRMGGGKSRICSHEGTSLLAHRSEEHTSELQSLMRISYAVFCLKKKK